MLVKGSDSLAAWISAKMLSRNSARCFASISATFLCFSAASAAAPARLRPLQRSCHRRHWDRTKDTSTGLWRGPREFGARSQARGGIPGLLRIRGRAAPDSGLAGSVLRAISSPGSHTKHDAAFEPPGSNMLLLLDNSLRRVVKGKDKEKGRQARRFNSGVKRPKLMNPGEHAGFRSTFVIIGMSSQLQSRAAPQPTHSAHLPGTYLLPKGRCQSQRSV